MKSGKFLKNMLEFGESLEKSGKKKCEKYARIWGKWKNLWKIEKFGKSLKSWKFGIILKNIFYRGKMKSGKFLKNMLEFGESGKIW